MTRNVSCYGIYPVRWKKYVEHEDFNEDVIADADILYMTRVQKEYVQCLPT